MNSIFKERLGILVDSIYKSYVFVLMPLKILRYITSVLIVSQSLLVLELQNASEFKLHELVGDLFLQAVT